MRKSFFPGTTGIFALFFVPYIVTIIFNGANTTLINKKFNVEMLLPVIVSSQIEDKYELETIKAQTIIARSNFYRTMKEEKNLAITLCQIKEDYSMSLPNFLLFLQILPTQSLQRSAKSQNGFLPDILPSRF